MTGNEITGQKRKQIKARNRKTVTNPVDTNPTTSPITLNYQQTKNIPMKTETVTVDKNPRSNYMLSMRNTLI